MSMYNEILVRERKKAYLKGLILNSIFCYYFWSVSLFLIQTTFEIKVFTEQTSFALLASLVPVAILQAWVWSRSEKSTGLIMIHKTNKALKNLKANYEGSWIGSFSGVFTVLLIFITIILGIQITDASLYALFSYQGAQGAQRIFTALFNPNWAIISSVLSAMVETIFIALLATLLAIPVSFVVSFLCARNLMKGNWVSRSVYNGLRIISNFTRSVEPIIWAIVFSVWVGIGPYAGMLALMIHSVAALVKLYSEQIENIDRGPIEAIEATGANPIQVVWFAVVPQIILPFLSFTIYRWDINVRMATIIGLVGGGGVGTLLMQYQGLAKWNEVGTIVIVIAIVVWVMDYLSARIREVIY